MLVGAAAQQRCGEARDVAGGRVDPAGPPAGPVAIGNWLRAASAEDIPGRETRRQPLRADEVGVGHAEGLEDALAEVPLERQAAHVLHDLAERGKPVVRVGEGRPGSTTIRRPSR